MHDHASVLALDEQLERAEDELMDALLLLAADNMAEWADRFAHALDSDAIVPGDF